MRIVQPCSDQQLWCGSHSLAHILTSLTSRLDGTSVCTVLLQEAVQDTTGAGDAFIGAMQYAICKGLQPDRALRLAAVVAACKCTASGARSGLPKREAVSKRLLI